jgi:DNA (cytosine-5)-methyltransferase 1
MNVDTAKEFTHVELCAGYSGIHLGLERVIPNLRTIAFCEIESFACENLVAKMEKGYLDAAPIWTNLKTFPWSDFRDRVDILSGGYPCQPFSCAGKRLGHEDPRHLWPYIADGIISMRPRLVFFENVEGHVSQGLREVLADLAGIGYRVETPNGDPTWGIFSASEAGAPHQRKRVFIMAVDNGERGQELLRQIAEQQEYPPLGTVAAMADGLRQRDAAGLSGQEQGHEGEPAEFVHVGGGVFWPSRPGQQQSSCEPPRII